MNPVIEVNLIYLSLLILFGVIAYIGYNYYKDYRVSTIPEYTQNELVDAINGKDSKVFPAGDVPVSLYGNEYNVSFWTKINDYSYNLGSKKHILKKGNMEIFLAPNTNNLHVRIHTLNSSPEIEEEICDNVDNCSLEQFTTNKDNCKCIDDTNICDNRVNLKHNPILDKVCNQNYDVADKEEEFNDVVASSNYDECILYDIPLQKWNHVSVNVYSDNVDMYIDGKLDSSCKLNILTTMGDNEIVLHPDGGYDGETNKLTYTNIKLSSNQIYNIYKKGPTDLF